jgi:hypothetical protein
VNGELIYGLPTEYRYTVEAADGSKMLVERRSEPVSLAPDERAAYERFTSSRIRSRDPAWSGNGLEIPDRKPAYEALYPGRTGRLLVLRKGPGERSDLPGCVDDPTPNDFVEAGRDNRTLMTCWSEPLIWDVFGADGRYLGELGIPDVKILADPFLDGETLLLAIEDDAGTIMVKRYRLVLPGEE